MPTCIWFCSWIIRWVSSVYSGLRSHKDNTNTSIGNNENDMHKLISFVIVVKQKVKQCWNIINKIAASKAN